MHLHAPRSEREAGAGRTASRSRGQALSALSSLRSAPGETFHGLPAWQRVQTCCCYSEFHAEAATGVVGERHGAASRRGPCAPAHPPRLSGAPRLSAAGPRALRCRGEKGETQKLRGDSIAWSTSPGVLSKVVAPRGE